MTEVDLLAIGCGPFNLGAAALASTVPDVRFLAVDARDSFSWHPGVMFPDATVQTSFLADLVSIIAPTHPLSFLQYLVEKDRMYPFYIRENFHLTRVEYQDYLCWAIDKLDNIQFGTRVCAVKWRDTHFEVKIESKGELRHIDAKNILCGIGTAPWVPDCIRSLPTEYWTHSSAYLPQKNRLETVKDITVVGSGQSGAEIFRDLLECFPPSKARLHWMTRSGSFAPLDYTKMVLEMTTPCYIRHFHAQSETVRDKLNKEQWHHYRGISSTTLEEIYELIYQRSVHGDPGVGLHVGQAIDQCSVIAELQDKPHGLGESSSASDQAAVALTCKQRYTNDVAIHRTGHVIAATGYRHRVPDFLEPVEHHLRRDGAGRMDIGYDHAVVSPLAGKVYIVNADIHSHGVAAPDLGICAWRNARILNQVARRIVYRVPQRTAFTQFGLEGRK